MLKNIIVSQISNIITIIYSHYIHDILIYNNKYETGHIYIGQVGKIFPSINSAFIDIYLFHRRGFLHIKDIKTFTSSSTIFVIKKLLTLNQVLIVQIIKSSTMHKAPKLTTNIIVIGYYIILMPYNISICISKKVYTQQERIYLKSLGLLLKPKTMGILFRSPANKVNSSILFKELDLLIKQWNYIKKSGSYNGILNILTHKYSNKIKDVIYDLYDQNLNQIIVDSNNSLNQFQYYLSKVNLQNTGSPIFIRKYKGCKSLIQFFKLDNVFSKSLQIKTKLPLGGYLLIETTEALTIIDVNTGSLINSNNYNEIILEINLKAAKEIAYQIKIRNLTGIILIDFIDMYDINDYLKLLNYFNKILNLDTSFPQLVQLSELGLLELTRKKKGSNIHYISNKLINKTLDPIYRISLKAIDVRSINQLLYRWMDMDMVMNNIIISGFNIAYTNRFCILQNSINIHKPRIFNLDTYYQNLKITQIN
uniref:ribonuclease E n=1 Tax=Glaucosphaera vacuolata TaxID=38265 RepID=UPI001FCCE01A|nr:ribonuclease E [Glaucosphaera vacuolata]UNJ18743.1 ribonuclease E [Glaucosphaera vacuolata]